jgi:hypothetical protein
MVRTYRLFAPVVAFFPDAKQTVVIPVGTLINLEITERQGPTHSTFAGRNILVQYGDVEENGTLLEKVGESGYLPHPI